MPGYQGNGFRDTKVHFIVGHLCSVTARDISEGAPSKQALPGAHLRLRTRARNAVLCLHVDLEHILNCFVSPLLPCKSRAWLGVPYRDIQQDLVFVA